jgi:hypothetical protein
MKIIREIIFPANNPYEGFVHNDAMDLTGWSEFPGFWEYLIRVMNPGVVIEVGTYLGKTSIFWGQKIKALGINSQIICIDTWLGGLELYAEENPLEWQKLFRVNHGLPRIYDVFLNNVVSEGLQDIITPIPLPSGLAAQLLKKHSIKSSLIYIDAGHDYNSVYADLHSYWDLLSPDGVMICDDCVHGKSANFMTGVREAVLKFCTEMDVFPLLDTTVNKCFLTKRHDRYGIDSAFTQNVYRPPK